MMTKFFLAFTFCLLTFSLSAAQGGMGPGPGTVHSAGGSVAFNASSKGNAQTGVSHTSSGSAIHMLTWLYIGNTSRSGTAVLSGVQSASFVGSGNNGAIRVELWHLTGVTAGTATVVATMNAGPPVTVYMVNETFTGSTSLGTLDTSDQNGSSNPTVNITSAATEIVADGLCWTAGGVHTATVTAPSTQRQQDTSDTDVQYASSTQAGAATTTMAWTLDVSYSHLAIAVKP